MIGWLKRLIKGKKINWSEWQDLAPEEFQEKWSKLSHEEKDEYLHDAVIVLDPVEFFGTDPGEKLTVRFWLRTNNQHYWSFYFPDTEEFYFSLHNKPVELKNTDLIKEKLLQKIGHGR